MKVLENFLEHCNKKSMPQPTPPPAYDVSTGKVYNVACRGCGSAIKKFLWLNITLSLQVQGRYCPNPPRPKNTPQHEAIRKSIDWQKQKQGSGVKSTRTHGPLQAPPPKAWIKWGYTTCKWYDIVRECTWYQFVSRAVDRSKHWRKWRCCLISFPMKQ